MLKKMAQLMIKHGTWFAPSKALGLHFLKNEVCFQFGLDLITPYRTLRVDTKVEDLEVEDLLCNDLRWGIFIENLPDLNLGCSNLCEFIG